MTVPGESDQNRKVDTSVMGGGWRRSKEGEKYIFIHFVGGGGGGGFFTKKKKKIKKR